MTTKGAQMNNVGAHQPAPWVVVNDPKTEFYRVEAQRGAMAGSLVATCGYKGDAYLIAAAPELLEALEYIVKDNQFPVGPHGLTIGSAAIAKAKGLL